MLIKCPKIVQICISCPTDSLQPHDSLFTVINDQEKQQKFRHSWLQTTEMIYWVTKLWEINPLNRRRSTSERNQVSVVKSFDSDDKMSVTGPGCSFWLRLWKVGLRPSKNPWQNQPPPLQSFPAQTLIHRLCADANLLRAWPCPTRAEPTNPERRPSLHFQ